MALCVIQTNKWRRQEHKASDTRRTSIMSNNSVATNGTRINGTQLVTTQTTPLTTTATTVKLASTTSSTLTEDSLVCPNGFPVPPAIWIVAFILLLALAYVLYKYLHLRTNASKQIDTFKQWSANRNMSSVIKAQVYSHSLYHNDLSSMTRPSLFPKDFALSKHSLPDSLLAKLDMLNDRISKLAPRFRGMHYTILSIIVLIVGVLCITVFGSYTCLDSRPQRYLNGQFVTVSVAWTVPAIFMVAVVATAALLVLTGTYYATVGCFFKWVEL
ncbi:hypothetical protein HK096_008094 [Nowakowskiella sp. JEL0078]|nr:hypothetical protein HK096_008094 [Nowakowskiella sp. JEL0078]